MRSKYVMISGLAFSEESDMEKLRDYAKQGWVLENIVVGFFYKLKKDKPQDIIYSLDYQADVNEEYFNIFKEAGWELVVSIQNKMHIFSAKAGTKAIYSDCESEIEKYSTVRDGTVKGILCSLVIAMVLVGLLAISIIAVKSMFLIILGLLIIDIFVFTFNFMPYLAYNSRIRGMEQDGKRKNELIANKGLRRMYAVTGVIFLAMGILKLTKKKYLDGVFCVMLGVYHIVISYKKYKKDL